MFTKALSFIKGLLTSFVTISPVLSAFGVSVPPAAVAIAPAVTGLMETAEAALGSGTGELKKEAVSAGLQAFAQTMVAISTGGQKETWAKVTPEIISATIDALTTAANGINDSCFDTEKWEAQKAGIYS